MTEHTLVRSLGLVRRVATLEQTGSRDVYLEREHVAAIWDTDPSRPTALFLATGRLSEKRSLDVMEALQREYGGRLRYVPPATEW